MEEFSKSYDCVRDQLWMTSVAMATALKSSVAVRKVTCHIPRETVRKT